jgi:hypothetical protein
MEYGVDRQETETVADLPLPIRLSVWSGRVPQKGKAGIAGLSITIGSLF